MQEWEDILESRSDSDSNDMNAPPLPALLHVIRSHDASFAFQAHRKQYLLSGAEWRQGHRASNMPCCDWIAIKGQTTSDASAVLLCPSMASA